MHFTLIRWARPLYLIGLVLALVLIIPTPWFPFQLGKIAAFAIFLFLSALCFVAGRGDREYARGSGFYLALSIFLLPVVYFVSFYFSLDRSVALTGFGIESDTIVFISLCAAAFFLAYSLFGSLRAVRVL